MALVAVTFNTIRLQILTQRDEIELCRLIGATHATSADRSSTWAPCSACSEARRSGNRGWGTGIPESRSKRGCAAVRLRPALESADAAGDGVVLAAAAALGWLGAHLSVSRHLLEGER